MRKRIFYNEELEAEGEYTEVWKQEVMRVRDVSDLVLCNHYWQDKDGELWVDFEDPNENLRKAFIEYRRRKGFMRPEEIKELRRKLELSTQDFAKMIGIDCDELVQIERNSRIQTLSQENFFKKIQR